jgi:hypothetical protein
MKWTGYVACIGEMRTAYKIVIGNPEGNRTTGRPSHRWEDIKMYLTDVGCKDDLIHLAQERGSCTHGIETSGSTHDIQFSYYESS